jgi:hypothetical protein
MVQLSEFGGGNIGFAQSTGRVRPIAPRTQNLAAAAIEGLSYTPLAPYGAWHSWNSENATLSPLPRSV